MANEALLRIKVVTDATQAALGLDKTAKQSSKFGSAMQKAALPAAAAGVALVALGKHALDSASDLQQAQGAVESVFGRQAGAVEKLSKKSAQSMGLAQSAYLQYAALVGSALTNAGFSTKQSVEESNKVMQRGADLAATFGGTTADAVEAINAAVSRGEFDPLEKYGVSLNMTAVNAELAARGQDKLTGSALKHAKAQVVLESVYKNTSKAAGQFARESDTAAGSAAIASAEFEDASAALGQALLPAASAAATALAGVARWASKNVPLVTALAVAVGTLVTAILIYNAAMKIAAIVQTAFNVAMSANVIFLVIIAIIALIAVIIIVVKKWDVIKAAAGKAFGAVMGIVNKAIQFIKKNWLTMIAVLLGPFGIAVALIIRNWGKIKAVASAVASAIKGAFQNAWEAVKAVASSITGAITHAFSAVRSSVSNAISTATGLFKSLPGKVKTAFSGAATLLYSVGSDIIAGLIRGITNAASGVTSAIKKIADGIPNYIKKHLGIGSPSKVLAKIGRDIMAGLEKGMKDGVAGVQDVTEHATSVITTTIKKAAKTAKQASALTRKAIGSIGDESAALEKNARKRQALYSDIAKQTASLNDQRDAWRSLRDTVADTAQSFGSFASTAGTTITDMLADMAARVAAAQTFQKTMAALSKLRLNKTTLTELAQAGPENALARAQALLAGGAGAVAQVNKMQNALGDAADSLGATAADAMYKTGIDATQALLDGLVSDTAALERTANKLARNLAAAVRKALKKYTPTGRSAAGNAAGTAVYGAPVVPMGRAATSSLVAGAGAGVHITVNGALDPEAVARQVGRLLSSHDRRMGVTAA